ncbi:membrane protein [Tatumella morbirosei]|uniref:Membrane protein n=2 Tax=Tatumella morbirosei TaxID=642227 RepID=A0A095VG44_9GAMM|nr:membrane protein [Tatumella morbirosei]
MKFGSGILNGWRTFLMNKLWRDPVRIFIAMTGCVILSWSLQNITWTIPLILGVVAAALTDIDDRLAGRLRNISITLACFCLATVSVELLFPHPWLFFFGLAFSSWIYILLGALGQRYATIAFGALLMAIYTMLGIHLFSLWYLQPVLLLSGALWYYLLTMLMHLLFPVQPVQEQLAQTYNQLAGYLDAKAILFDPDAEATDDPSLIQAALVNSQLVSQFNQTKTAIQSRLSGERAARNSRRSLLYYFAAQEIHERANSSHIQYHLLRKEWRYSEILFRFQRLMHMQASACRQVAHSVIMKQPYHHDSRFERSFFHLQQALDRLATLSPGDSQARGLHWLLRNLKAIDDQLISIASEQLLNNLWLNSDTHLSQEGLTGWQDVKVRLTRHLSPKSALFRHAVRMSVVLCVGYAFIVLTGMDRGYWILLTSLFVCQPNYAATRKRLALRIIGTLAGIIIGLPVLWLVPSIQGQLILIVVSGVLFFAFRLIQYAQATLFITLLALLSFNLLGEGFDVALPRILDTLIGCALSWMAVAWIFPDWRYRQLPDVINKALAANNKYLDAILEQYHEGKDNRMSYRVARRDAHNSDAELALVISNLNSENGLTLPVKDLAFRVLCLNHSFLSYISALGAHRERTDRQDLLQLLDDTVNLSENVLHATPDNEQQITEKLHSLIKEMNTIEANPESREQVMLQQIGLLLKVLPEIISIRKEMKIL